MRDTNLLVWGVDLVEEHMLVSVGIPSRPPLPKRPLMQMAEYSINAEVSAEIPLAKCRAPFLMIRLCFGYPPLSVFEFHERPCFLL